MRIVRKGDELVVTLDKSDAESLLHFCQRAWSPERAERHALKFDPVMQRLSKATAELLGFTERRKHPIELKAQHLAEHTSFDSLEFYQNAMGIEDKVIDPPDDEVLEDDGPEVVWS